MGRMTVRALWSVMMAVLLLLLLLWVILMILTILMVLVDRVMSVRLMLMLMLVVVRAVMGTILAVGGMMRRWLMMSSVASVVSLTILHRHAIMITPSSSSWCIHTIV